MARVFIAKFDGGLCPGCDDYILVGDEVSYTGDVLVHAECNEDTDWSSDLLDDFEE